MILSTKLLRRINPDAGVVCCKCNEPSRYYDAAEPECVGYCGQHALLEDLDPDDALNDRTLMGYSASRTAAFPECMDIAELFDKAPVQKNQKRGPQQMWARMETSLQLNPWDVVALPATAEWIGQNSIYGGHDLDRNHYIEITQSLRDGQALGYIRFKFQQIIGSRFLAVVPWETVVAFFGEKQ